MDKKEKRFIAMWGKDLLSQVIQFPNGHCIQLVPNNDGINVLRCKVPEGVEVSKKDFIKEILKTYDGSDKRELIK